MCAAHGYLHFICCAANCRYLDHNALSCVETGALGDASKLEIVSLNGNNITSLPAGLFDRISDLRILRLSDNALHCDCNLAWLGRWLRVRCGENINIFVLSYLDILSRNLSCCFFEFIVPHRVCQIPNFTCKGLNQKLE